MKNKYSIFSLFKNAFSGHENWQRAWRDPEPKNEYDAENQRQILASLDNIKNQLNFSFQKDLKDEQDAFNYFMN